MPETRLSETCRASDGRANFQLWANTLHPRPLGSLCRISPRDGSAESARRTTPPDGLRSRHVTPTPNAGGNTRKPQKRMPQKRMPQKTHAANNGSEKQRPADESSASRSKALHAPCDRRPCIDGTRTAHQRNFGTSPYPSWSNGAKPSLRGASGAWRRLRSVPRRFSRRRVGISDRSYGVVS